MLMTADLLSREAIDRKLLRDVIERTGGRKLVGVKFDPQSHIWYVVLKTGVQPVRVAAQALKQSATPARRASVKGVLRAARKKK